MFPSNLAFLAFLSKVYAKYLSLYQVGRQKTFVQAHKREFERSSKNREGEA